MRDVFCYESKSGWRVYGRAHPRTTRRGIPTYKHALARNEKGFTDCDKKQTWFVFTILSALEIPDDGLGVNSLLQ